MAGPICEVIITADSEDWLINFTRILVTERLVACAQHVTPIRSIYRWNGAIHDDHETRVALHTRSSLVQTIIDRTAREHPYELPCVLALPIEAANPAYVEWVISETNQPSI